MTVGQLAVIVVVYRPAGSDAIQRPFFDELSSVTDAALEEPPPVAGKFNIWFDRLDDPHT